MNGAKLFLVIAMAWKFPESWVCCRRFSRVPSTAMVLPRLEPFLAATPLCDRHQREIYDLFIYVWSTQCVYVNICACLVGGGYQCSLWAPRGLDSLYSYRWLFPLPFWLKSPRALQVFELCDSSRIACAPHNLGTICDCWWCSWGDAADWPGAERHHVQRNHRCLWLAKRPHKVMELTNGVQHNYQWPPHWHFRGAHEAAVTWGLYKTTASLDSVSNSADLPALCSYRHGGLHFNVDGTNSGNCTETCVVHSPPRVLSANWRCKWGCIPMQCCSLCKWTGLHSIYIYVYIYIYI